jgi:hypothetical protein
MRQMMELLLKEIRAIHAEMDADRKKDNEDFLARWDANMKAWREKAEADMKAMREEMGTSHMEMVSEFKPEIEEETMTCREATEARLEEKPVSVYTKPAVAQQDEVLVEDTEVMLFGEPKKKRHRAENWPRSAAARSRRI